MKKIITAILLAILMISASLYFSHKIVIDRRNKEFEKTLKEATKNTFPSISELPTDVAKTRLALIKAARDKSYEELVAIGEPKYTFGDDYPGGFIAWLKYYDSQYPEKTSFDNILELMNQPYAKQTYTEGWSNYIWPEKFVTTDEYYGYRIFIDQDGNWILFISGD